MWLVFLPSFIHPTYSINTLMPDSFPEFLSHWQVPTFCSLLPCYRQCSSLLHGEFSYIVYKRDYYYNCVCFLSMHRYVHELSMEVATFWGEAKPFSGHFLDDWLIYCICWLLCCYEKYHDHKKSGKERIYFLLKVVAHHLGKPGKVAWGRNRSRTEEEYWVSCYPWLVHTAQNHRPWTLTVQCAGSSTSTTNQKKHLCRWMQSQAHLMEASIEWKFPLP